MIRACVCVRVVFEARMRRRRSSEFHSRPEGIASPRFLEQQDLVVIASDTKLSLAAEVDTFGEHREVRRDGIAGPGIDLLIR